VSWTLLVALVLGLGLALLAAWSRRIELSRMQRRVNERERNVRVGSVTSQLQHPVIDLTRCLGCGTCVRVCPEKGVLEMVHGQAMVVNGSRCTGVSQCEAECPVGAITVTLTSIEERRDIPAVSNELEAVGTPGLFLAGEVTAKALIKSAIEQGTAVADEVARRMATSSNRAEEVLDLCVVGAGPAGLACSLEAKRHGLSFITLDQADGPGGTVAKYPRRKLVLTQPVDMPMHGRLERTTYSKEELVDLWSSIASQEKLPIHGGQVFEGVERQDDGNFVVHTTSHRVRARNVCIAIGRRGTPRKLDVPGEELSKVAYSLLDASSYQGRRILVVGGGDSAVEAAVGLAEQPGNEVTLSYRGEAFNRIRLRNEERLEECRRSGRLRVLTSSTVHGIRSDSVDIELRDGPSRGVFSLPNDDVFVMAGGVPPFELLERSGVSFDPALRAPIARVVEQGSGLLRALTIGFLLALTTLTFALKHSDFYTLPLEAQPVHELYAKLRPSSGIGLWFGIAATLLIVVNLLYLLRRAQKAGFTFGSLKAWMTSHIATGILALLLALLHGGMSLRNTVGGHALWGLAALLLTGAIGRYFYAYVPRAANGRELELEEVKVRLSRMAESWDESQKAFVERARSEVTRLVETRQWRGTLVGRALALLGGQRELRTVLATLEKEGRDGGVADERVQETLGLARQAYRLSLMAAHYEDLRALLNSWRYVHRWVAALMVVLLVVHIVYALTYGSVWSGGTQ
jgi:thioredoxin reductase/Pyruvate/2-oxoacid:ferredoxin oxidoreductase delta subunit/cytochrome b561